MSTNNTTAAASHNSGGKKKEPVPLFERAANVVVDATLSRVLSLDLQLVQQLRQPEQQLAQSVQQLGQPEQQLGQPEQHLAQVAQLAQLAQPGQLKLQAARRGAVAALLGDLPSSIATALTRTYVDRFVELHCQGGQDPLLLVDILGGSVTDVDLSPLVKLGQQDHGALLAFNERLLRTLPRLQQLSRLVLATHGKSFTLPVCSDRVLEEIALRCPRLVSLDVSHNTGVSATGLTSLCAGCPLLEELFLFDCVIPTAVLAGVLAGLPRLRLLGHKEVGMAVLRLWRGGHTQPLRLTHVTNLGEATTHKSATEPHRLRCRLPLVRALRTLCPALENLKVRALDEDLRHLGALPGLSVLELRYHAAPRPSSLAAHSLQYLRLHAARLSVLTVYSHSLKASDFTLIGQHCPGLQQLWMRTNQLVWEPLEPRLESLEKPRRGRMFARLENLSLRVGWNERSVCSMPAAFLQHLLRDVAALRKLYVAVNSGDVTDAWLRAVLESFDTSSLRSLFVLLPNVNSVPFALQLSMASVSLTRSLCPDLEELGNLLVWSLQQEEVRYLQHQLAASNSVLRLVAKETVWR